jgi:hypothetical protein
LSAIGLITTVISVSLSISQIMESVKLPANETLSRWVCQGAPLLIGVGIVGAFGLHLSFGLPFARLAFPIAVLVGIQMLFFIGMYGARKRYQRTGDLRTAALVLPAYGLCIVLAGMHFAGQLGIVGATTFDDDYVGFSVFMGVVTCIVVGVFSFVKRKPQPSR